MKPKEILVNLPAVHLFATEDEIPALASAVNTFVHGKVKIKCETVGVLGGQFVGLFYIQRNNESQDLREKFISLINEEEDQAWLAAPLTQEEKEAVNKADSEEGIPW
jgi:hypothetical protein